MSTDPHRLPAPEPSAAPPADRFQRIRELARADTLGDLMQRLSRALSTFVVEEFEVFLIGETDAVLVFSRGKTSQTDGKIELADHPWLNPLFEGEGLVVPGTNSVFFRATAALALPGPERLQGILVVYGPTAVLEEPVRHDLDATVELFSISLHQIRTREMLQRSQQRATAKLDEFQEAQDILFLEERNEILQAVLGRGLRNLGAMTGAIVLGDSNDWSIAHQRGEFVDEPLRLLEHMVHQCYAHQSPGLINALSGEENWTFDIDTIHMASVVVFPLMGRGRCIGALVAFDATASLDNIEMVQATTRAGATAVENWEMRQKMLRQQRLEEQMDLAAKAQQRLLPAADPSFRGVRVTHLSLYCDETGGDYVDAFTYEPSGSVGSLVIGDVAGHGLGAAMLMIDLRARLRTMLTLQNPWAPHAVLNSASSVLHTDSGPEEFVTLFLATVDARTGVMRYANAGHEHPLLYKANQKRWIELESTGVPLGLVPGARYDVGVVSIEPGDILLAMTDGVTEAQALSGEVFGTDVAKRAVEALVGASPEKIMEAVVAETVAHRDRRAFSDDLTFLIAVVEEVGLEILEEPPTIRGDLLLETEFPSTAADKDQALREIDAIVRRRFPKRDIDALMLSCEEAMSNAVIHGNSRDSTKQVAVRVVFDPVESALTLIVKDQGEGFDPKDRVQEHFEERALHRVNGRGLVIMANLVDRVAYWNGGRTVALTQVFE